jgi:hypothetical protein
MQLRLAVRVTVVGNRENRENRLLSIEYSVGCRQWMGGTLGGLTECLLFKQDLPVL